MPDRFEEETVGNGFDVILGVIEKIAAFQEVNGFNGPQKKAKAPAARVETPAAAPEEDQVQ